MPNNELTSIIAMVAGRGFEPLKAEPADLQSAPIGRSGNPPLAIEQRNYTDLCDDRSPGQYSLGIT